MAGTGEESMEALVEFVGARLAEDRQWAHWATRDGQTEWFNRSLLRQPDSDQEIYTAAGVVALVGAPYGPHIARWDPQRVLDEVNAKGLLLERAAEHASGCRRSWATLRCCDCSLRRTRGTRIGRRSGSGRRVDLHLRVR
jgi:hypothetical protein